MDNTNLVNNVQPPRVQPPRVPQLQPQYQMHQMHQMPQVPLVPGANDGIVIFGNSVSRQHLYIVGLLLVAVVAYFLWNWYSQQDDGDEDLEEDEFDMQGMQPPMGAYPQMGGFPPMGNSTGIPQIPPQVNMPNEEVEEA